MTRTMQLRRMERIGRVGLVAGVSAVVGWTVLTANPVAFVSAVAYGAVGTLLAISSQPMTLRGRRIASSVPTAP